MRLVYEATGEEVKVGDKVTTAGGEEVTVAHFAKPHKSSSSGKVTVEYKAESDSRFAFREFYVSVIGAKWIEREDQGGYTTSQEMINGRLMQVVRFS